MCVKKFFRGKNSKNFTLYKLLTEGLFRLEVRHAIFFSFRSYSVSGKLSDSPSMETTKFNQILIVCFFISCGTLFWIANQTVPVVQIEKPVQIAHVEASKIPKVEIEDDDNIERELAALDAEFEEAVKIGVQSIKEAKRWRQLHKKIKH